MLRKLFVRKREEPLVQDTPLRVSPAVGSASTPPPSPTSMPPDAILDDDLDQATRVHARWQLIAYGVPPDDPRLNNVTTDSMIGWMRREQDRFVQQELAWWDAHISSDISQLIAANIERYRLGGGEVPSVPFVRRSFDYGGVTQYTDVPITTARMLLDRGLAISQDAESRRFLLLSGIKRESAFSLALDPEAQRRLIVFAEDLRTNRSAAESLMRAHWDELPPNRGEEYDAMPFIIAERRIAYLYRQRNEDDTALGRAIAECQAMIDRSPEFLALFSLIGQSLPEHRGLKQLAIIREKERDYAGALSLSEHAANEGWAGDWEKRITRLRRKLDQ